MRPNPTTTIAATHTGGVRPPWEVAPDYLERAAHAMVNTFEPTGIGAAADGRDHGNLSVTAQEDAPS